MTAISIQHVSKQYSIYKKEPGIMGSIRSVFFRKYETISAIKDISFSIEEGELVGFIGPNGAGKTTTLKCLSGLLYPTCGSIEILGYTPFERKSNFLKNISLVMGQKNQLWWDLPPMESFLLNKEIYEVEDKKFQNIIEELSRLLDVGDMLHIPVKKLSLGQRMKMELIAALIHSPKVLFLDEPTIGLDVVMQKNLRDFIKEYNKRYNATIILTSHYMGDVEALCKRVIVINHGIILFDGLLSDLAKKHAPYKIITVILSDMVNAKKFENLGEIKNFQFPKLTLRIHKKQSNSVLSKVLNTLPVEDVSITDPQIEDIIRDVFSKSE